MANGPIPLWNSPSTPTAPALPQEPPPGFGVMQTPPIIPAEEPTPSLQAGPVTQYTAPFESVLPGQAVRIAKRPPPIPWFVLALAGVAFYVLVIEGNG